MYVFVAVLFGQMGLVLNDVASLLFRVQPPHVDQQRLIVVYHISDTTKSGQGE
jgi:hypothetical protein